tara:strand:+ start:236 stop:505 length:270 start_codon:yes stop_codon:yes gene_type:complete
MLVQNASEKLSTKIKRNGGFAINSFLKKRIEKEVYNISQPFTSIQLRMHMIDIYGTKFAGNSRSIGYILTRMENVVRVGKTEWRVRDGI